IDDGEAGRSQAARAAIALLTELELDVAGTQVGAAAPVQRLARDLEWPPVAVDRLGVAQHTLRLTGQVRVQALARLDAIPAAARRRLAVIDANRGHHPVRRVVAPGQAVA